MAGFQRLKSCNLWSRSHSKDSTNHRPSNDPFCLSPLSCSTLQASTSCKMEPASHYSVNMNVHECAAYDGLCENSLFSRASPNPENYHTAADHLFCATLNGGQVTSPINGAQQTFVRMQGMAPMMAPFQNACNVGTALQQKCQYAKLIVPVRKCAGNTSMERSFATGMAKATVHAKKIPQRSAKCGRIKRISTVYVCSSCSLQFQRDGSHCR